MIHIIGSLVISICLISVATAAERPNILVILTDDVGWGDYQCYNAQGKIPTPSVDRLAREGMRFTNAHTPAALCAPTRYSMLTGNYPWRGREPEGVWGFNVPSAILPEQKTIANLLQDAGYRTAMFGKSGIGGEHTMRKNKPDLSKPAFSKPMTDGPKRWGFDYSYIIPRGHQALPHFFLENELPECGADKVIRGSGEANYSDPHWDNVQLGEKLLAHAEKFLDDVSAKNKSTGTDAPFYMHFCSDGAHAPYAPAENIRGTALKDRSGMTQHTDMVLETDVLLGKLMGILESRGLSDNTLVCITSDNGGIPVERAYGHDAVGGLRGKKSYIFEGGTRVPFVLRWPKHIPPGAVRNQVVGTHDVVATALDLAGVNVPQNQCLDSVSLKPVLFGVRDDRDPVRKSLLTQSAPGNDFDHDGGFTTAAVVLDNIGAKAAKEAEDRAGNGAKQRLKESPSDGMAHAIYQGHWKLVIDMTDEPAALYDLHSDPAEQKNLIEDVSQSSRIQAMASIYREIRASKRSVAAKE